MKNSWNFVYIFKLHKKLCSFWRVFFTENFNHSNFDFCHRELAFLKVTLKLNLIWFLDRIRMNVVIRILWLSCRNITKSTGKKFVRWIWIWLSGDWIVDCTRDWMTFKGIFSVCLIAQGTYQGRIRKFLRIQWSLSRRLFWGDTISIPTFSTLQHLLQKTQDVQSQCLGEIKGW